MILLFVSIPVFFSEIRKVSHTHMIMNRSYLKGLAALLLVFSCSNSPKPADPTPAPTPEPEPITASAELDAAFQAFVEEVKSGKLAIHQVAVARHGVVLEEEYFGEWTAETPHQMWSTSKTFTSLAVGFAIQDGLLSLDTKISDIFPEQVEKAAANIAADIRKSNLRNGTVKDYLRMACGHNSDATFTLMSRYGCKTSDLYEVTGYAEKNGRDLIYDFFNFQFLKTPGSTFVYDSISSYVLAAAVQKVSGKMLIDYLDEKLFTRIGVEKPKWDEVLGVNCGGWGLFLAPADMIKVGLAMLAAKKYYGEEIFPADYLKEATAFQWDWRRDIPKTLSDIEKRAYTSGYGYQIWRNEDAFFSKGMLGQYIYVIPALDVVMAVTGSLNDDDAPTRLLWKHLIPVFESED